MDDTPLLIDARGMRCPWPAIRAARALRDHPGAIDIIADDPAAPTELASLAAAAGATITPIMNILGPGFRITRPNDVNVSFTRNG